VKDQPMQVSDLFVYSVLSVLYLFMQLTDLRW